MVNHMMGKTKLFGALLAAFLVLGLLTAVSAKEGENTERRSGMHKMRWQMAPHPGKMGMIEDLGLEDDASREEIMEALWDKKLKDLELTPESKISEFQTVMRQKRQERMAEKLSELGLDSDASPEDIMQAMKERMGSPDCNIVRKGAGPMGGFHGRAFGGYKK
jgi:hypothetical protein